MAASDAKEILEKIENGVVKVPGKRTLESKEKKRVTVQPEGEAHQASDVKAGTNTPDAKVNEQAAKAPKVEKVKKPKPLKAPKPKKEKKPKEPKPKEPAKPKVAEFPFQTTINPYGFIGLGKGELRALGLTVCEEKGEKRKIAKEVPLTFKAWNLEKRELTVILP